MENKSCCYYPSNILGEDFKVTEVAFSLDGQDFRRSLGGVLTAVGSAVTLRLNPSAPPLKQPEQLTASASTSCRSSRSSQGLLMNIEVF